jgi:protein ImuA
MQVVTCHAGKLQTLTAKLSRLGSRRSREHAFATDLPAFDALAPGQSLARGAVHELLHDPHHAAPSFVAALLARSSAATARAVVWSDPHGTLYPPALAALGVDLDRLYVLRPRSPADEAWAVTECLRCRGVGAVIAAPPRGSRVEARRFQLAAEHGGTVGVLVRPLTRGSDIYAAATRWLVAPARGERTVQRWSVQLVHGHGGRVGEVVFLEWCRETHSVRAVEKLADRPAATTATPQQQQRRATA